MSVPEYSRPTSAILSGYPNPYQNGAQGTYASLLLVGFTLVLLTLLDM